ARFRKLDLAGPGIGDGQGVVVGQVVNALRFVEASESLDSCARFKVEDLNRIIAQRRNEQSLALDVRRQVIKAAFDPRQRDGAGQLQNGRLRGLKRWVQPEKERGKRN